MSEVSLAAEALVRLLAALARADPPAGARRIGKPVISSNLALLWHMLGLAGMPVAPPGDGPLFANPTDAG